MDNIYDKIVEMVEKPTWKTLLIDTVKSAGLDPWDIDIEVLAGKFAERIKAMKEMNLRVPANAILASSILLRFKSDNWIFFPREEEEDEGEELDGRDRPKVDIPELPPVKRITRRKVTLDDLIKAIEEVMEKEIRKKSKKGIRPRLDINPMELLKDSFFNDEEFERRLNLVWLTINQKADESGLVLFSEIVPGNDRQSVVKTLIPVLHLANEEKIYLWQEDFFDDIIIRVNGHAE